MKVKSLIIVIIPIICIVFSNCCSSNQDSAYKNSNYSYNHSYAKNVSFVIRADVIGNTPINIIESNSTDIYVVINYYWKPGKVEFTGKSDDLKAEIIVSAPSDRIGMGANISIYLPNNAKYNFTIHNSASQETSVYREHSKTVVGDFSGPIHIIINNQTILNK